MIHHIKGIRSFNRFYTNIIGLVDQHILNSPYSLPEVRILYEMYYHEASTASEIMKLIHIDKGYLSRILLKFEKSRLISKKRSAKDGRSVSLLLTPKGRKEFEKLDNASHQQIKSILDQLPQQKHKQLLFHMNEIKKILQTQLHGLK